MMVADLGPIDGSWELNITVTDLQVERTLRVTGDLHIGGVMLQLVEALDIALDWSDHALWWPEKNMWLGHSRSTLDQYGVQADARLQFTPMHKSLRVQLPDLQVLDLRVDCSVKVFSAVRQTCKEIGIRNPEEMSFMRKLNKEELKRNLKKRTRERETPTSQSNNHHHLSSNSIDGGLNTSSYSNRSPMSPSPQGTLLRTPGTPGSPYTPNMSSSSPYSTYNGTLSPGSMHSLSFEGCQDVTLANSPQLPAKEALEMLYRPKSFSEKAYINGAWLDSSRSLMEQGIRENDIILLKFKFYSFYDLNPKYDSVRINQIYEQARWSIMAEEIDCTEEEMMVFAALQVQIQMQVGVPQPDPENTTPGQEDDDIDAALKDLQESLEGNSINSPGDITHIPELGDYVKFFKPKKFTLKNYKKYWCTFKDTHVSLYKSRDEASGPPVTRIDIRGCEANPDVNISARKYGIKLFVPSTDGGMTEVWLRFDSEQQYARWMAACKLASKGKTMADSTYESEVQSLTTFLTMQHPAPAPSITASQVDIQAENYVAPRFFRKLKSKQLVQRIMEAHANVKNMNLMESKMAFIKAWQALPEYGITYFIIRMSNSKKDELIGVAYNRIMRMDLQSGDSIKAWRYNVMKSWHVNWEVRHVVLDLEDEHVAFACHSADCKIVHEFIGGYIFLSMRSQDKNQSLNEELFHKLTGGWAS